MTTQHNPLMFRNIGQFIQNGSSHICKKIASFHSKLVLATLQYFIHRLSILNIYLQKTPHCQEGRELDGFTIFVSQASYYLTQYTPCQFLIERDIIQSDEFILFLFKSTIHYPCQFSDYHGVIQSLSGLLNTSKYNSPQKLYRVISKDFLISFN